jgi:hypothetical protein
VDFEESQYANDTRRRRAKYSNAQLWAPETVHRRIRSEGCAEGENSPIAERPAMRNAGAVRDSGGDCPAKSHLCGAPSARMLAVRGKKEGPPTKGESMTQIKRWAIATVCTCSTLAGGSVVQGKWPSDLKPSVECAPERSGNTAQSRVVRASGVVGIESSEPAQPWIEITVGARATLTSLAGTRTLVANITMTSLSRSQSNVFATDFNRGPIGQGEEITTCEVFFVRALHGVQKPVTVTARETAVAKDDDCFADFMKAQDLKGLEFRKRITELLQYGCIRMVPLNWMVSVGARRKIGSVAVVEGVFSEYAGAKDSVTGISASSDLTLGMKPFIERVFPESVK